MVPLPNGESDKYYLQGLGRTKNLEQLSAYITLCTNYRHGFDEGCKLREGQSLWPWREESEN